MDILGELRNRQTAAGDLAADYITSDTYGKLLIEIDYVQGAAPNQEAVSVLMDTARDVLDKDVVNNAVRGEIPGESQGHKYTWQEISDLEEAHRDNYPSGDTMVLYILYLDGGSVEDQGDQRVLGAAYRGSSVVMFKGNVREASCTDCGILSNKPEERFVERAVIVHELGHILGLVNNGIPMQRPHEDPDHEAHSRFEDSVMYWAVESSAINNIFDRGSSIPYEFDEYDREDIRAVRTGEVSP